MATGRKGPKTSIEPAKGAKPDKSGASSKGDDGVVEIVKSLAAVVAEHALTELIVDTPSATITLRRGGAAVAAVPMSVPGPMHLPAPMPAPMSISSGGAPFTQHHTSGASAPGNGASVELKDDAHLVTSPFVGTFYRRPNPDSSNYVDLNERVDKGTVLCIVEAMKLMNEIEADIAGTIVGVLAEDGAPVEYGQPLFKIAPA